MLGQQSKALSVLHRSVLVLPVIFFQFAEFYLGDSPQSRFALGAVPEIALPLLLQLSEASLPLLRRADLETTYTQQSIYLLLEKQTLPIHLDKR